MSAKRILDICASLCGLVVLIPIMMGVAIAILFAHGRPVFFCQLRSGKDGKSFVIFKFRTMRNATDEHGGILSDAARVTALGDFLRRTSLDELPSLFNVLAGDMSLVGPRPFHAKYLSLYDKYQLRRFEVKPGITGWAQINGRNAISWEEKFEFDVWYVDNKSIRLDARILFATLIKLFHTGNVNQSGHATMPEFRGSEKGRR